MYKRSVEAYVREISQNYSIVAITGPRQSGKSTLCKHIFKDYKYLSFEDLDVRTQAIEDPRGFLKNNPAPIIFDEIQRAPEILSYLQSITDNNPSLKYVITGSNHLLLIEKITQSLAGRVGMVELLPLSLGELKQKSNSLNHNELLFLGGYPKIHAQKIPAQNWLAQYFKTYVEKDIRQILNVSNLDLFDRFVRLCAGRAGNLLNLQSLANDCGISQSTTQRWLSLLKSTYICFTLAPHFKNFGKRLIKTPKLYFYDTGLLSYLLRVESPEALQTHPFRGAIFENFIVTEMIKNYLNRGQEPPLYFWRDQKGHEVDLVIDTGLQLKPFEIKSAYTFDSSFIKDMNYLNSLGVSTQIPKGTVFYGGDSSFEFQSYDIKSWNTIDQY